MATIYVVALIQSHAALPSLHIWVIAAIFSVIMNFVYFIEAGAQRRFLSIEIIVAVILVTASVLGILIHPIFVIAAIFGHGVWDLAKYWGAGIPFFSWYTLSCFAVDMAYGAALLTYWSRL